MQVGDIDKWHERVKIIIKYDFSKYLTCETNSK
ncbi:MAG: hypothetical protein RL732_542 [Bacteroidota bacterium]|jgi:hypothetical protein